MSSREPESHFDRMTGVLRRVHARRGNGEMLSLRDPVSLDGELVDWNDPLSQLMEAEEQMGADLVGKTKELADKMGVGLDERLPDGPFKEELLGHINEAAREEGFKAFESLQSVFLEVLFAMGPNPLEVVKRLFAYVKNKRPDLLLNMSFRDLGDLFDETHATVHARCDRLFGAACAGWKKSDSARRNMARAQQGNTNRRGGVPRQETLPE